MKSIIILVMMSLVTLTFAQKQSKVEYEKNLLHTNPLPNLTRIVLKYKKELELTEKQFEAILFYSFDNRPVVDKLVKQVLAEEKKLHDEALSSDEDVLKKSEKMLQLRREIMHKKTLCRANIRKILNKKQFEKLVEYYKCLNGGVEQPKYIACKS